VGHASCEWPIDFAVAGAVRPACFVAPFIVRCGMPCDALLQRLRSAVSGDSDEQAYTTARYAAVWHQSGCSSVGSLQFVRIV
jgi:hypothetical protein